MVRRTKATKTARDRIVQAFKEIGTPAGHARVAAVLASGPFPRFEAVPGRPGLLVKIDEDGTRSLGRFVKRTFTPEPAPEPPKI